MLVITNLLKIMLHIFQVNTRRNAFQEDETGMSHYIARQHLRTLTICST